MKKPATAAPTVNRAREQFLAYVAHVMPAVLERLQEDVLPLYRAVADRGGRGDGSGHAVVASSGLTAALVQWSQTHNLDADWLRDAALSTLKRWHEGNPSLSGNLTFAVEVDGCGDSAQERYQLAASMADRDDPDFGTVLALIRDVILGNDIAKIKKASLCLLAVYQLEPRFSIERLSREIGISRQAAADRLEWAAGYVGLERRTANPGGRPRTRRRRVTRKRRQNRG